MSQLSRALPAEPSLRIGTLSLWVLGRQYPDSKDSWDGNWLQVVASCAGVGSRVEVSGPILDTLGFVIFLEQVQAMVVSLTGAAELTSVEPEFELVLRFSDTMGHIEGKLEITGNHLQEHHQFTLSLDQSFLPSIVRRLQSIVAAYPVVGVERRRT